jgi:hypothetical protein
MSCYFADETMKSNKVVSVLDKATYGGLNDSLGDPRRSQR